MDASVFLALAGAVNRLVSALKPRIGQLGLRFGWSDDVYDVVLQLIAIVAGIILALTTSANVIPASLNASSLIGMIITGVLIGLGSDVLNAVIEFLYKPAGPGPGGTLVAAGGPTVVAPGAPTVVVPPPDSPGGH